MEEETDGAVRGVKAEIGIAAIQYFGGQRIDQVQTVGRASARARKGECTQVLILCAEKPRQGAKINSQ